jgi:hypothetical protein
MTVSSQRIRSPVNPGRFTLLSLGYEAEVFTNDKPYLENGYETFTELSPTDWILRVDCDEMPSKRLIQYCESIVKSDVDRIASFERHQLIWDGENFKSSSAEPFRPGCQLQYRLFNRRRVTFEKHIHTHGITIRDALFAPADAMLMHMSWIFLTWEERKEKSERYDAFGQEAPNRSNQLFDFGKSEFNDFKYPVLKRVFLESLNKL